MNKFKAMKAVYCYFFPEVEKIINEVDSCFTKISMNRVTTPAIDVYNGLKPLFNPPLEMTQTQEGYIDLDEIHVPIIERIIDAYSSLVPNLKDFEYRYPTPGSSEGIFNILAKLKTEGINNIYVLYGEYEGYGEYAKALKMNVIPIDLRTTSLLSLIPGVWFISNPSARDGNIIPNWFIDSICAKDHKVILDIAYVGATRAHKFDVSNKNIIVVFMSLSKPYGLFRYRIGFTFSREPIVSLYGNKWFKDASRLIEGLKVVEDLGPKRNDVTVLFEKYRPVQIKIINNINKEFGLNIKPSDSLLLGYIKEEDTSNLSKEKLEMITPYKRGHEYRFCLTPYFEGIDKIKKRSEI